MEVDRLNGPGAQFHQPRRAVPPIGLFAPRRLMIGWLWRDWSAIIHSIYHRWLMVYVEWRFCRRHTSAVCLTDAWNIPLTVGWSCRRRFQRNVAPVVSNFILLHDDCKTLGHITVASLTGWRMFSLLLRHVLIFISLCVFLLRCNSSFRHAKLSVWYRFWGGRKRMGRSRSAAHLWASRTTS